jgi:hypothetical protein
MSEHKHEDDLMGCVHCANSEEAEKASDIQSEIDKKRAERKSRLEELEED